MSEVTIIGANKTDTPGAITFYVTKWENGKLYKSAMTVADVSGAENIYKSVPQMTIIEFNKWLPFSNSTVQQEPA